MNRSVQSLWRDALAGVFAVVLSLIGATAWALPGDIIFSDDFEDKELEPEWVTTDDKRSDVDDHTSNSPKRSMYLSEGPVTTMLDNDINLFLKPATLALWVRRGRDDFSENPDAGEDLVVEFRDENGAWIEILRYGGDGTPGEVITDTTLLPTEAFHANFNLRFRLLAGTGEDFDFWHIDDVELKEAEDISGNTIECDDFSTGDVYETVINAGGFANVDSLTFQSPTLAMSLHGGEVAVASPARDTSIGFYGVTIWVRRGHEDFSDNPGNGDDFSISYLDDNGQWVELDSLPGNGDMGEIISLSYDLSEVPAAQHPNFRLRLHQLDGGGITKDYWHFDDVCFVSASETVPTTVDLSHDGSGQYCSEESVVLTARDTQGNPMAGYVGTIALSTDTARGDWRLVNGSGTLSGGSGNDGAAQYEFVTDDGGSVTLGITYVDGATPIDIDAIDTSGGIQDDDSEGTLAWQAGGFTLTGSALSNPPPATINDPLGTQTAAIEYTAHVSAFAGAANDANCGVLEGYSGTRTLEFWQEWINPGTGTVSLTVNGAGVGPDAPGAIAQDVTFTNGQAELTLKYKDVGDIALHMVEQGTSISGSTNAHVVVPADLSITTVRSASGVANPGTGDATGTGFVASGDAFDIIVDVLDAEGSRTPNFGLESPAEGLRVMSHSLAFPPGGRNGQADDGVLPNGTQFVSTGVGGQFRNQSVVFDEVGSVRLQVGIADDDYLGAGATVGAVSGIVGRFYVDEFVVNSASVTPSCSTFTYMSEPALGIAVELEARNALGQRTQNYDAALLGSAAVADPEFVAENADAGTDLGDRLVVPGDNWTLGLYDLAATTARFDRLAGGPDGPFDDLTVGLRVDDVLDSRLLANADLNPATAGDCVAASDCDAVAIGQTEIYYGRIAALPALGPELQDLDLGLTAQRWNGSGFVRNVADSCSAFAMADMSLDNFAGNLIAGETAPAGPAATATLVAGVAPTANPPLLSAPGSGNDGTVDVTYDVADWLEFDWLGAGDTDPFARAMFGYYRGHDKVVAWREFTR